MLFPVLGEESRLLVGCRRYDYSASVISRAVEDCDAHLLNLNVLGLVDDRAETLVELRVDRRDPVAIARSLERYGYEVLELDGYQPSIDDTALTDRIEEVLHYLEL